jgi:ribosomal protein S12 methylthiotransferase
MDAHPDICPYLDIPVQHASDRVLRTMGRRYTEKQIYALFSSIRKRLPRAALRTTMLVGFPGEDERDFDRLLALTAEVRFEHLGVFVYSDGSDLPAHCLPRHVPKRVAAERRGRLMEMQAAISLDNNRRYVGKCLETLITGPSGDTAYPWEGRSRFQAPDIDGKILIRNLSLESGSFADLRIEAAGDYDLFACYETS